MQLPSWLPVKEHNIDDYHKLDELLSTYVFPYTTPKTIKIKMWQIGLLHRLLQAGVFVFMCVTHYTGHTWARSEVPIASVNAYHSAGGFHAAVNVSDYETAYGYCAYWATNLYREDDYYDYDSPRCLLHSEDELVQKAAGAVHYTTACAPHLSRGSPLPHARDRPRGSLQRRHRED